MSYDTSKSDQSVTSDIASNLSNHLPTGTFLAFQALAPLFTNNGVCRGAERVMTGLLIMVFLVGVFFLSFVDSITTDSGKVYYGIVTDKGLYNPQFAKAPIQGDLIANDNYFTGGPRSENHYRPHLSDVVYGLLNLITFGTLCGLTPPITTCYYPGIPEIVTRTAPILVSMTVGLLYAFVPYSRNGVGYALASNGIGFIPEIPIDTSGESEGTQTVSVSIEDGNPKTQPDSTILDSKTNLLDVSS